MSTLFQRHLSGFTLVEVTLAILVVGLGMLTVFSLFPAGLTMNKKSIDETRAAMFAEDVFSGYRARVDSNPVEWDYIGPPYNTDDPVLAASAADKWSGGAGIRISQTSDKPANQKPVIIRYVDESTNILHYSFRYTLDFSNQTPNRIKYARLRVWNGEFGPTNISDAVEFYTEFYNFAMPP